MQLIMSGSNYSMISYLLCPRRKNFWSWAGIEPRSSCFTSHRSNHLTMPPRAHKIVSWSILMLHHNFSSLKLTRMFHVWLWVLWQPSWCCCYRLNLNLPQTCLKLVASHQNILLLTMSAATMISVFEVFEAREMLLRGQSWLPTTRFSFVFWWTHWRERRTRRYFD